MQKEETRLFFVSMHYINTTLPGYCFVFVENSPKKPKPKEAFSWELSLPAEGFPAKDSLSSQALSQNAEAALFSPLSSEEPRAPFVPSALCEAPCMPHHASEAILPLLLEEEEEEAELEIIKGEEEEEEEAEPEVRRWSPVRFSAKPKPRIQRMAPEFASNTHEYSGALLEEIRCFHGMTLGELADVTRVAQHHLQNIECEQYDRLPATVYLRGYLKTVARELGLDMQLVSQSYLERMEQAKS